MSKVRRDRIDAQLRGTGVRLEHSVGEEQSARIVPIA
jgi:hypothetical protein